MDEWVKPDGRLGSSKPFIRYRKKTELEQHQVVLGNRIKWRGANKNSLNGVRGVTLNP